MSRLWLIRMLLCSLFTCLLVLDACPTTNLCGPVVLDFTTGVVVRDTTVRADAINLSEAAASTSDTSQPLPTGNSVLYRLLRGH